MRHTLEDLGWRPSFNAQILEDAGAGCQPEVGDWLLVDDVTLEVRRVLQRENLFKRQAPGTDKKTQLIAANVHTLFIVASCNKDFQHSTSGTVSGARAGSRRAAGRHPHQDGPHGHARYFLGSGTGSATGAADRSRQRA